jgi:prevent-host-death family protein
LNQQTSAVIAEVLEGGAVTITSGGKPVARIVPLADLAADLSELVRGGLAIAPSQTGPLLAPPPTAGSAVDVAGEIAREREESEW